MELIQVKTVPVLVRLDQGKSLGQLVRHVLNDPALVADQILLIGLDGQKEALEFEPFLNVRADLDAYLSQKKIVQIIRHEHVPQHIQNLI